MIHAASALRLSLLFFFGLGVSLFVYSEATSAQGERLRFELIKSSYPAAQYKSAFEEDLSFPQRTCFRAMNGDIELDGLRAITIANQCQNNLIRLNEIREFANDFLRRGCIEGPERLRYFTSESTALLCNGYLSRHLLPDLEQIYIEFSDYRDNLLVYAEKCRLKTGDAGDC